MQNRRRQKVIIGTLCAVIIGMVVGYAALSQILNINGTSKIVGSFDIQFTKISENTMTNATTIKTDGVGTTTATFNVDLKKPGSSAIYDVTVENKGTIDAVLKSIEGLDESNLSEPLDIKYSLIGLEEEDELNASASKSFQVKVIWDSTSTSIPNKNKTLTLKLNYEQKTSSSGGGGSTGEIASTYLIENDLEPDVPAGGSGLVALDNAGKITTGSNPREYRYIGSIPDNYVSFNNELWRIIGIFDGQVKLIRKESLMMAWDKGSTDGGTHGTYGWNDWSQATLQVYLNGEYLSSIDNTSASYISDYTWKLGGVLDHDHCLAQQFYEYERGTEVYNGRPSEWTGRIALMYASDYGFSTSGGSVNSRNICLTKALYNWDMEKNCKHNSWLRDTVNYQWTLTPRAIREDYAIGINSDQYLSSDGHVDGFITSKYQAVRPTLFLKPDVEIISGTGAETDPFILQYNP